jgi:hypothetical protein
LSAVFVALNKASKVFRQQKSTETPATTTTATKTSVAPKQH